MNPLCAATELWFRERCVVRIKGVRTRSCGSSWPGYAETSSWTLARLLAGGR